MQLTTDITANAKVPKMVSGVVVQPKELYKL